MKSKSIFSRLALLGFILVLLNPNTGCSLPGQQTLVFIGDCITADYFNGWYHYTDNLAEMEVWEDLLLLNKAVGGSGAYSYHDYPGNVDAYILDNDPDYVCSCLGMADMYHANTTKFYDDYKELIETLLSRKPGISIFLCRFTWTSNHPEDQLESYMAVIDELAQEFSLPVADVYNATKGHEEYFIDGSHPSSLGASVIAATINDAFVQHIKINAETSTTTTSTTDPVTNAASFDLLILAILPLLALRRKNQA